MIHSIHLWHWLIAFPLFYMGCMAFLLCGSFDMGAALGRALIAACAAALFIGTFVGWLVFA